MQGRKLTKSEKKKAGPVVHYAFGAIMGAVYGAATRRLIPSGECAGGDSVWGDFICRGG